MQQRSLTRYSLYLLLFLIPILPFKTYIGVFPLSAEIILIPAFIFGFIYDYIKGRVQLNNTSIRWILIPYILFMIFAGISLASAHSKSTGILELARLMSYFLLLAILLKIKFIKEDFIKFWKILMVSFTIVGLYGVFQYLFNYNLNTAGLYALNGVIGRVDSFFGNPNYYAGIINLILPMLLIGLLMYLKDKKIQLLLFGLYGLLVINLMLTYTRAAWLIMVGAFVLMILLLGKKYIKQLFKKHILISFIILGVIVLSLPDVSNRFFSGVSAIDQLVFGSSEDIYKTDMLDMIKAAQEDESKKTDLALFSRKKLWMTGIKMYLDNPVFGVGMGNYLVRYQDFVKKYPELDIGHKAYSVHNSYIKVAAETGTFGIITFCLIYLALAYKILLWYIKNKEIEHRGIIVGIGVGIITYLLQNLTNNLMFIPQVNTMFWLVTGTTLNYLANFLPEKSDS